MKKLIVLIILICLVAISFSAVAGAESSGATINAEQSYTHTIASLHKGKNLNWSWAVDQFNLDFYIEDPSGAKYYESFSKSSDYGAFTCPETGKWLFVWLNENTATTSEDYTIKLSYDITTTNKVPDLTATSDVKSTTLGNIINFNATAVDHDGEIVSYEWDFGDGSTSKEQSPSHKYAKPGNFVVICTVTDNEGAKKNATLKVGISDPPNIPPVAKITTDKTNGLVPLEIKFTGEGTDTDGTIEGYAWDFGDGEVSVEQNPAHKFDKVGTYTVKLTVTDDDGAVGQDTVDIEVKPVPVEDPDKDDDGIPDEWEEEHGLDPTDPTDASADADGDGLTNFEEYTGGSDLNNEDSDNDGLPDKWEADNGLDPLDPKDADEDSDGDGSSNKAEFDGGTDPTDSTSVPKSTQAGTSNFAYWIVFAIIAVVVLLIVIVVIILLVTKKKSAEDGPPEAPEAEEAPVAEEPEEEPVDAPDEDADEEDFDADDQEETWETEDADADGDAPEPAAPVAAPAPSSPKTPSLPAADVSKEAKPLDPWDADPYNEPSDNELLASNQDDTGLLPPPE